MASGHKSILLVEDDEDVRGAIAMLLEGEGYAVVEAEHGADALHQLQSQAQICIILLDLFMPVMNGLDFRAEQLRDPALASIPVVVISADRSAEAKAARLGAAACLTKPIDFDRLLELVGQHC